MLTVVLAEASLETVPAKIAYHPVIVRHARRKGVSPLNIILDDSLHHIAMKTLKNWRRRGRPDIVHFCLLTLTGSPLYREGKLRIMVHTCRDIVIRIAGNVRLPRHYERFKGLMSQLLRLGRVPPTGKPLMEAEKGEILDVLEKFQGYKVIAFTEKGEYYTPDRLRQLFSRVENPVVVVGAFPHGELPGEVLDRADYKVSVYESPLDAWIVLCKLLCAYEEALGEKG